MSVASSACQYGNLEFIVRKINSPDNGNGNVAPFKEALATVRDPNFANLRQSLGKDRAKNMLFVPNERFPILPDLSHYNDPNGYQLANSPKSYSSREFFDNVVRILKASGTLATSLIDYLREHTGYKPGFVTSGDGKQTFTTDDSYALTFKDSEYSISKSVEEPHSHYNLELHIIKPKDGSPDDVIRLSKNTSKPATTISTVTLHNAETEPNLDLRYTDSLGKTRTLTVARPKETAQPERKAA